MKRKTMYLTHWKHVAYYRMPLAVYDEWIEASVVTTWSATIETRPNAFAKRAIP